MLLLLYPTRGRLNVYGVVATRAVPYVYCIQQQDLSIYVISYETWLAVLRIHCIDKMWRVVPRMDSSVNTVLVIYQKKYKQT